VPLGTFRTWVKYVEKGTWPHTRRYFSVLRCNHCDDAPCVTICPTVALYRRADGIVDFDGARCIGCKSCMQGAPTTRSTSTRTRTPRPSAITGAPAGGRARARVRDRVPRARPSSPAISTIRAPRSRVSSGASRWRCASRSRARRPKVYYVGADSSTLSPTLQRAAPTWLWGQRPAAEADLVGMVAALQASEHGARRSHAPCTTRRTRHDPGAGGSARICGPSRSRGRAARLGDRRLRVVGDDAHGDRARHQPVVRPAHDGVARARSQAPGASSTSSSNPTGRSWLVWGA